MKYVGIATQQRRNNFLSMLLLALFPIIILGMVFVFFYIVGGLESDPSGVMNFQQSVMDPFLSFAPLVILVIGIWFCIAYFSNTSMIRNATHAMPLTRMQNPRVYNIVENLCIANGMDMPKINIVDDPQLNAFASGIDKQSYTVTVTTGIMAKLNDEELEGVIAHELTHIRNRDTRLLIISIVFVGILSMLSQFIFRSMLYTPSSSSSRRDENGKSGNSTIIIMLIALVCSAIAYVVTILTRFALSRKREFMADAGGAEMTHNPLALASALRKISNDPGLTDVKDESVAQLFIFRSAATSSLQNLLSTHPDIKERIRILEQF